MDKANANPDRVKQQLAEVELVPEDWGGDTMVIEVDSLSGRGIEDLLESLVLVADDNEFTANPNGTTRGIVIESQVDKFKGTLATLLVMNGTLHVGDAVVVSTSHGRIKAMYDENGKQVKEAPPSTPVSVLGLNDPPQPGDRFEVVASDKEARIIADERLAEQTSRSREPQRAFSLEDVFAHFQQGETKELKLIVKADVQGSLQPIIEGLEGLSEKNREGIKVRVLAAEVGDVSESDVMLAAAGEHDSDKAIIIGFNVKVGNAAKSAAEAQMVEIRAYRVIYKLFEDMEAALEGMLEPVYEQKTIGTAEVRQLFRISRVGVIAGSTVIEGEIRRKAKARVIRNGKVLVDNMEISSLKRFNEDVSEVRQGFECGISLHGFNDFEEGDKVEFFVMERVS